MKNRFDLTLSVVLILSVLGCAVLWFEKIDWLLYVPVVPFFCAQLLLCRRTRWAWMRVLPALPVLFLLGAALFYLLRDSGWDALAALILGIAAISPAVGVGLGWGVWAIGTRSKKSRQE